VVAVSLESPPATADGASSLAHEIRAEVEAELTADLDADQFAYRCAQCGVWCINPRGHRLTRARVCVDDYVSYLSSRR